MALEISIVSGAFMAMENQHCVRGDHGHGDQHCVRGDHGIMAAIMGEAIMGKAMMALKISIMSGAIMASRSLHRAELIRSALCPG